MIRLTVSDSNIVQTLRIDTDKAFIGRSPSNTVVLKDPLASRKHCLLRVNGTIVEILDLNSKHGLKINGQDESRAFLSPGDRVEIGAARICLEEVEAVDAALARFGGYLDDDDHLYTMKDSPEKPVVTEPDGAPDKAGATPTGSEAETGKAAGTTFADDLFRVLRRTPAWGSSLIAHALLLVLLFRIPWVAAPEEDELVAVNSGMSDGAQMLEPGDLDDQQFELPQPDMDTEFPPIPDVEDPDPASASEDAAIDDEPFRVPVIAPSEDAFRMKVSGLGTRNKVELGPNKAFDAGGSGEANRSASGLVLESLGGEGGRLARLLRRRPPSETIVVRGTYDRVETVLDLFRIPHTLVDLRDLKTLDFGGVRTIFVNCSNEAFPEATVEKVADFVATGGYLFTTDWALENVIEKAFPRTIECVRERGQIKGTPDMVIAVAAALRRHFFLQGTGLESADAQWWLEDSSYPLKILRPDIVEVLVSSEELKKKYRSGAVAATFRWGKGRVVHVMGHYFQKKGNLRGTFAMQKIITNFLVASIRNR